MTRLAWFYDGLASMAYLGGTQPSEVGRMTRGRARQFEKRLRELRDRDRDEDREFMTALASAIVKSNIGVGNAIMSALAKRVVL